jgi:hypothetical protein
VVFRATSTSLCNVDVSMAESLKALIDVPESSDECHVKP